MEAAQPQACRDKREEKLGTTHSSWKFLEAWRTHSVLALEASRSLENPQCLSSGLALALTTARQLFPVTLGNSHSALERKLMFRKVDWFCLRSHKC